MTCPHTKNFGVRTRHPKLSILVEPVGGDDNLVNKREFVTQSSPQGQTGGISGLSLLLLGQ